jgi:hypothetical protein
LLTVSVIRLLVSSLTVARSGPTRIDECDAPRVLTATIRDLFTGTTRVKAAAPCNSRSITDDLRWGDYFGRAVNLAARIASQAAAKQVFVGEDLVWGSSRSGSTPQVRRVRFEGHRPPMTIYEAVRDGPG